MAETSSGVTGWLWVGVPRLLRHLSRGLVSKAVDGLYLAAYPIVPIALPLGALALGLYFGALSPLHDQIYTESLVFLMIAAALGSISGHVGGAFLIGFVTGDFCIEHPLTDIDTWSIAERVPLLIVYGVLAFPTTVVPIATKTIVSGFRPPKNADPKTRPDLAFGFLGLIIGLHAVLTGVLVYFWTQAAPMLIRPVFTWPGGTPTVKAMGVLQEAMWWIVAAAVLAALARMVIQGMTAVNEKTAARLDVLEKKLNEPPAVMPLLDRTPWFSALLIAVWSTLLLSGLFDAWFDWLIVLGAMVFFGLVREDRIRLPLDRWRRLMEKIPLLVRLIAGMGLLYLIASQVFPHANVYKTFRPVLLLTLAALVILYLLNPGPPEEEPGGESGGESDGASEPEAAA